MLLFVCFQPLTPAVRAKAASVYKLVMDNARLEQERADAKANKGKFVVCSCPSDSSHFHWFFSFMEIKIVIFESHSFSWSDMSTFCVWAPVCFMSFPGHGLGRRPVVQL
jgi:hypothetical protein